MKQSKYIKDQSKQTGFTLLELLMVIAVIGVLATIAVPRLQNYSQKAKFTEVINATAPYKAAVEQCLMEHPVADCDGGANGIPPGFNVANGRVASVNIVDGVITAAGTVADFPAGANANGVNQGATYQLTPTAGNNSVTWATGGTCQGALALCN